MASRYRFGKSSLTLRQRDSAHAKLFEARAAIYGVIENGSGFPLQLDGAKYIHAHGCIYICQIFMPSPP